jgi:hypothetical protein
MQNDCIVSNIRAIAISSSIVIEPFWRLINDNSTNHFDLHQYVVPLQQALYRWGKDSTVLLNNSRAAVEMINQLTINNAKENVAQFF